MAAPDKAASDAKKADDMVDATKADDMVEAVVAKGRTVVLPGKKCGQGETVLLSKDEAASLRARGYLVDESAAPIPYGNGPTFTHSGGPTIKGV